MKGLRLSLEDITTFYRIWDVKRVVLKMNRGYYAGLVSDKVKQFKQVLKIRRQKEQLNEVRGRGKLLSLF